MKRWEVETLFSEDSKDKEMDIYLGGSALMYARVEDAWYPKAACAVCGAESMFQCSRLMVCAWLVHESQGQPRTPQQP